MPLRCSASLGFTDAEQAHGTEPKFPTLNQVLAHYGAKSTKELDTLLAQRDRPYGFGVYAVFRDLEDGYVWTAYRFKNQWAVGTSADRLQLRPREA